MKLIRGRVWKFGDSIDTDIIAPGGDREERLKETTMIAVRPEFPLKVKPGDIIVAGKNFGCGSHRETANSVLREMGISAIVAESIARIFFRVSISMAFPAFTAEGITDIVEDGDQIEIDYKKGVVFNISSGKYVLLKKYPPSVEAIFDAGGIIELLKQKYKGLSV